MDRFHALPSIIAINVIFTNRDRLVRRILRGCHNNFSSTRNAHKPLPTRTPAPSKRFLGIEARSWSTMTINTHFPLLSALLFPCDYVTISTCYSPKLLDATSRLQSFQFRYQSSLPRWLRTSLDEHPSPPTPFLLSPTLVNTSASALEAREKFRRSLVCRAVAEARHGSSRIRWKFYPARRFKSQNRKFSNRILDTFVVILFFRDSNNVSLYKFSLFVCYGGNSLDFHWKLLVCGYTRSISFFFFVKSMLEVSIWSLERFLFIYRSIYTNHKVKETGLFVLLALLLKSQFIIVFLSKRLIRMINATITGLNDI